MTNLNLAVYRGNTDTRTVTVTASGAPYDLTGKSLRFVAKAAYSVVDAQWQTSEMSRSADTIPRGSVTRYLTTSAAPGWR